MLIFIAFFYDFDLYQNDFSENSWSIFTKIVGTGDQNVNRMLLGGFSPTHRASWEPLMQSLKIVILLPRHLRGGWMNSYTIHENLYHNDDIQYP